MGRFLRVNCGGENKKASRFDWRRYKNGGKDRDRTGDTRIFSPKVLVLKKLRHKCFFHDFFTDHTLLSKMGSILWFAKFRKTVESSIISSLREGNGITVHAKAALPKELLKSTNEKFDKQS